MKTEQHIYKFAEKVKVEVKNKNKTQTQTEQHIYKFAEKVKVDVKDKKNTNKTKIKLRYWPTVKCINDKLTNNTSN